MPAFRHAILVGSILGLVIIFALPRFFDWISEKPGLLLLDPVLARWGPWELSPYIFALIYGMVVLVIASVAKHPLRMLHGLYAYLLLMILRMIAMSLITLEPPIDSIPLIDPLTLAFYPGGTPFMKDLFFSGHTATLALMTALAVDRPIRILAACSTVMVGLLVMAQHVHWTVDVLAAIPATWLAWKCSGLILRSVGLSTSAEAA